MSSKSAAAGAGKEITILILYAIQQGLVKFDLLDAKHMFELADLFPSNHYLHDRLRLTRKMKNMEALGYLSRSNKGYRLGLRGQRFLAEEAIWKLTIPTPKKWGKKWYFVVFDIPVDKKKRRDIFRLRIKELGLKMYQNSVWIYPHPIEEVVKKVSDFYYLSDCVSFITAEEISGEAELKRHFKL